MEITFRPPAKTAPGYLKRMRQALEFARRQTEAPTPELVDELVDFLVAYVVEPADRAEAKAALWEATEDQFTDMLGAISGGGTTVDPKASAS